MLWVLALLTSFGRVAALLNCTLFSFAVFFPTCNRDFGMVKLYTRIQEKSVQFNEAATLLSEDR